MFVLFANIPVVASTLTASTGTQAAPPAAAAATIGHRRQRVSHHACDIDLLSDSRYLDCFALQTEGKCNIDIGRGSTCQHPIRGRGGLLTMADVCHYNTHLGLKPWRCPNHLLGCRVTFSDDGSISRHTTNTCAFKPPSLGISIY